MGKEKENGRSAAPIKDSLIGLELRALSRVLADWSKTGVRKPKKLQAFRKAVMTELTKGKKESIPHEIVEDEFRVMLGCVKWAQRTGKIDKVESRASGNIRFWRAFPCSPPGLDKNPPIKRHKKRIHRGVEPEHIARDLVAERLYVSNDTVDNALSGKKARRFETTAEQRLLISLFLDVSAGSKENRETLGMETLLLDTLLATEYLPIAIYYVVQIAHSLERPIAMGKHDHTKLKELCKRIRQRRSTKQN